MTDWLVDAYRNSLQYNSLVVFVGVSLLGASAGLLGCFAILRGRALTGDALAHAALPGICVAFLLIEALLGIPPARDLLSRLGITTPRSLPMLLLGAFGTGLLGVTIISALRRWTRIKEDTAIGIVLSVFFGAGMVLLMVIQKQSTTGSKAGIDSFILGKTAGMAAQDVFWIAGVALASLLLILLAYKEFKLVVFDPGFARVQGWPTLVLDLILMALISLAVVIGLPAVGVVMMAALLIVPGAAARFWTERLGGMLILSAIFGLLMALVGTAISANFRLMPAGPIIVLAGSVIFVISFVLAPRRGLLGRWREHRRFRQQLEEQKLYRLLYRLSAKSPQFDLADLLSRRSWSLARLQNLLAGALQRDFVQSEGPNRYGLTERGLAYGAEVDRDHREWERSLEEHDVEARLPLVPIQEAGR